MYPSRNGSTFRYRRNRARVLAASTVCYLCGEDGADAVDHVLPVARGGTDDVRNLRPVHHAVPNSHGVQCNRAKGVGDPPTITTTSRPW